MGEYDVVIAGGGPSGLNMAREIVKRSDYSVAVLESDHALDDNDKSTGGTFDEVIAGYDIPVDSDAVLDTNETVTFEGPNAQAELPISGYVLNFPAFQKYMGEDAEAYGADIMTGAHVTEPVIDDDGRVAGVWYVDKDTGEPYALPAEIVVDATGPAAALTSDLGFFSRDDGQRGIGLEFEVEDAYETDETMVFRFDHNAAPGGYAWTFPAGDDAYKAGVCWVDDFYEKHGDDRSIRDYVLDWMEDDPRWDFDPANIRETHAGEAVSNNSLNQRATDGFMAVGDAVSSINPLFGEGIRPGMESAEMAADVALDALDAGDTSEEKLREYEQRWNDEKGRDWKLQRMVGELLYDFDAEQQDAFVRKTGDMSAAEAEQLRQYDMSARQLARLYPFKAKDLKKAPKLFRHL